MMTITKPSSLRLLASIPQSNVTMRALVCRSALIPENLYTRTALFLYVCA